MLQIFAIIKGTSVMNFGKNPQHDDDFPKMRGGGSTAVWNFSENSSVFGGLSFPKLNSKFVFFADKVKRYFWTACQGDRKWSSNGLHGGDIKECFCARGSI